MIFCITIQESCSPHKMENKKDASQPKVIVTLDLLCAEPLGFPEEIPWEEDSCPILYLPIGFAQRNSIFLCGEGTLGFHGCRIRR